MFGYIVPDKPELRVWEYEVFRGYYCGVCKTIAKRAGHRGRIILSYDSAFLAVLIDSLEEAPTAGKQTRCLIHPLKNRFMANSTAALEFASDINILLAYYNLKDKWLDEKRLEGPVGMMILGKGFKKVKRKYPGLVNHMEQELITLGKLERQKCGHMEEACEPFARIMRKVFEYAVESDVQRKVLGCIGYNLGKWVYLLDAYDDIEDNIKSGAYNPLLHQFEYEEGEEIQSFRERIREKTEFILVYSLSEMEKAFALLEIKKNQGILENIVYRGLLYRTRKVLENGADCNEKPI